MVMLAVLAWAAGTTGCKNPRLVPWDLPSVPDPLAAVENDPRWPSLERSMVFHPARYPAGDWKPRGLAFEDSWFHSADGTKLHGWYVPHANPRAAVLYCHGNAGNLTDWAEVVRKLNDQACVSVLIFDYRGYGRSEGKPTEKGILEDARAARAWLARRERIPETEVVLLGRSLGGAVVVELAQDGARALILESTFTSIRDVAAVHAPYLPVNLLMRMRLDSAAKIARYHGPLLQSHGDADRVVPYDLGQRLFGAASGPKRFVTFPGRDHNDPQPDDYYGTLVAFLDGLDRPPIGDSMIASQVDAARR
jgi:fermentation-respiration switch protein FrsA (DUF1100 family)